MERVSISRLKDQLSAYLKKVQAGETVLVMDRNKPVAQLTPLPPNLGESEKITRLEAAGVLLPPQGPPLTLEELRRNVVKAPGARLQEALLEDREDGR
jgi:prevent-host-death family protein